MIGSYFMFIGMLLIAHGLIDGFLNKNEPVINCWWKAVFPILSGMVTVCASGIFF